MNHNMKTIKVRVLLTCAGFAIACSIPGQQLLAQAIKAKPAKGAIEKPLPLDAEVRTGKLPNGFTYYIRHNQEPRNRVTFYLANKIGSVLENEDQRGLAHFMEHMSFNGTKHFPKSELVNYLQKSGVRFGADLLLMKLFTSCHYRQTIPKF
jgi:zinc protease